MPIIPPGGAPYPILQDVLNLARTRVLDAIYTPPSAPPGQIGGETLGDQVLFTQVMANGAWQQLQEFMANIGVPRLTGEVILDALPVIGTDDPGTYASITWAGYNNGIDVFPTPQIPQNVIRPMKLWERVSGAVPPNVFTAMEGPIQNGLEDQQKQSRNYQWAWTNDGIRIPGSTSLMDIRIRFALYLPDFETIGDVEWYNQKCAIMRCTDALAWYITAEFVSARNGPAVAAPLFDKAEAAATKLADRDKQAAITRSEFAVPDIPVQTGNTPYDFASTILNQVRVLMNAVYKVSGDVISLNSPWTQQLFNGAYRKLQDFFANAGAPRLTGEAIITLPGAVTSADPSSRSYLSWNGYFDGTVLHNTPTLPNNLIYPTRCWERSDPTQDFTQMEFNQNGLQDFPKQERNYAWEWRMDALLTPGSTAIMQIKVRYASYLPDLAASGSTPWYLQQVQIARCMDALSLYICAAIASAKPELNLNPLEILTSADAAAQKLVDRDAKTAGQRGEWIVPDIPAVAGNTPQDVLSTILNATRVRLNRVAKAAGDIFATSQLFAQQCTNNGWRKLQEFLWNLGYTPLINEVIIAGLPPTAADDPAIQNYLNWAGFFDGVTLHAGFQLPQELVAPLRMWERVTGQAALFCGPGLEPIVDGLYAAPIQPFNYQWEWRNNAIYIPGASQSNDFRIRYGKYLPDFAQIGSSPWYLSEVPIARCQEPLSLYICAEVARARPDLELDPTELQTEAESTAKLIINRDIRMKQRVNARRQSRSGRLEGGNYYGIGGYGPQ